MFVSDDSSRQNSLSDVRAQQIIISESPRNNNGVRQRARIPANLDRGETGFTSQAELPDNLPAINLTKGMNLNPNVVRGGLRGALDANDLVMDSGKVCRICLDEEDPSDLGANPLITPCSCTGSMRYIHVQCVREWLDSKK